MRRVPRGPCGLRCHGPDMHTKVKDAKIDTVLPGGPRKPGLEDKQTLTALPGVVLHEEMTC